MFLKYFIYILHREREREMEKELNTKFLRIKRNYSAYENLHVINTEPLLTFLTTLYYVFHDIIRETFRNDYQHF